MSNDKRIVLGDRNNLSITPIKHQWAMQYFDVMTNNFWNPHIVNMVKDSVAYAKVLNADEIHTLHHTLGYLATADVVAMRNISVGIADKVTCVEVELVLNTITYQEAIHTLSYNHILDSLSIPLDQQNVINNYYNTCKSISNKIEYSTNLIDRMLKAELSDDLHGGMYDFIHGYFFFSQIFEGCLFVNGFNPVLSLNRQNKMSGTAEQFNLIRQDEELHKAFGAKFIKETCKETGFVLDENYCLEMMRATEKLERAYMEEVMPNGLVGYSIEDHMLNFRFLANVRMKHFMMKPAFQKYKKLSWHDTDQSIKREANFFERTVTDYNSGTDIMSTF